jgi:DNA-binding HxlR family transcriptional regulator
MAARSSAGVSVANRSDGSGRADYELVQRIDATLDVLHGRWKVPLLFLMARGIHRHGRLLQSLPGVSKKVMTETLRALERDGLVQREVFAEVPVRVHYSLTSLGWSISEPLMALAEWGNANTPEIARARVRFAATLGKRKLQPLPGLSDREPA